MSANIKSPSSPKHLPKPKVEAPTGKGSYGKKGKIGEIKKGVKMRKGRQPDTLGAARLDSELLGERTLARLRY